MILFDASTSSTYELGLFLMNIHEVTKNLGFNQFFWLIILSCIIIFVNFSNYFGLFFLFTLILIFSIFIRHFILFQFIFETLAFLYLIF